MTSPYVRYWAPVSGNRDTIASLQTLTVAGDLTLNSNLRNSPVSTYGPYIYQDVVRSLSFTSANNLSARTFTINGIGSTVDVDGNPTGPLAPLTVTRVGPNNTTVFTPTIWKQIDSISVDGAVADISVGFGDTGITQYIFLDYNKTAFYATCQMQVIARIGLTYSVYQSLTKPETPNTHGSFDAWPIAIPASYLPGMLIEGATKMAKIDSPITIIWASITGTTVDSAYFTVLQQGTCS